MPETYADLIARMGDPADTGATSVAAWTALARAAPWSGASSSLAELASVLTRAGNRSAAEAVAEACECRAETADPAEALSLIETALSIRPDHAVLLGRRAAILAKLSRLDEAADTARLALAADPAEWRALVLSAELARDDGAFDQAIALARKAVAAQPMRLETLLLLATLLRNQGHAAEAAALLTGTAEQTPDRAELWNHLGLAWRAANRPDLSLDAFRRAAQLNVSDRWAETNMAFSLLREPGPWAPATFAPLRVRGDSPEIGLGLFCDRFPHTYGFLIQQYLTYLHSFPDARVYSYGRRVFEPYRRDHFTGALERFSQTSADVADRVVQLAPALSDPARPGLSTHVRLQTVADDFRRPRLAHCIFAMNADLFRPLWDELAIPFTFTLNPGGGFRLDDPYSDERLRRIFGSPNFRMVVVTYALTRDYIKTRFGVPDDKIRLIPGTVVLESLLMRHRALKRFYGRDKPTLDVCFGGMRYTPRGTDKGYDRFIAAAQSLARRFADLRLHVIGDFDPNMVDVSDLGDRITFHGPRDQRWMADFYSSMDIIVSPNVANQISLGAFDGFPVTTCIEAGMCGVALFATDPMGLNFALKDGSDFVLIDYAPEKIAEQIGEYLADPDRLYRLAAQGERTMRAVWGEEAQMAPRVALMRDLLG